MPSGNPSSSTLSQQGRVNEKKKKKEEEQEEELPKRMKSKRRMRRRLDQDVGMATTVLSPEPPRTLEAKRGFF